MALTGEQVAELKRQLHEQIANLPSDKKAAAAQQIDSMSPESLEVMLNQQRSSNPSGKTIFRMIIDNEADSIVVQENDFAKAVMDISPISKGHVLIIPKSAVSDTKQLPDSVFDLAKEISKRISSELNSKSTSVAAEVKFGEAVVHIIPSYTDAPMGLSSPRNKSSKEELEGIAAKLRPKEKKKRIPLIRKKPAAAQGKSPALVKQRRIP